MGLTKAQRTRLDKLATYLEGLPADYEHFGMKSWLRPKSWDEFDSVVRYARENGGVASCGTAACAVGHGPAAGVLVPSRHVENDYVDWSGYSTMFVPSADGVEFTWLFASKWCGVDNHHYGAAARIRYLLDRGVPPEGFRVAGRYWPEVYAPYRIDAKVSA